MSPLLAMSMPPCHTNTPACHVNACLLTMSMPASLPCQCPHCLLSRGSPCSPHQCPPYLLCRCCPLLIAVLMSSCSLLCRHPPARCIDAPWILCAVSMHLAPVCHVDAPSPSACVSSCFFLHTFFANNPSLILLASAHVDTLTAYTPAPPPARCVDTAPCSLHDVCIITPPPPLLAASLPPLLAASSPPLLAASTLPPSHCIDTPGPCTCPSGHPTPFVPALPIAQCIMIRLD
jgi:hypothetical protein